MRWIFQGKRRILLKGLQGFLKAAVLVLPLHLAAVPAAGGRHPTLALAVGGFPWGPDGKVKQLDWETGNRMGEQFVNKRGRLGSVPFAEDDRGQVVWFEDAASLDAKWTAASQAGFRGLMIWRLGGNDDRLFQWLGKVK